MTNDAKLGLVLGVAIVLLIGLVFFRTEPSTAKGPSQPSPVSAAQTGPVPAAHLP